MPPESKHRSRLPALWTRRTRVDLTLLALNAAVQAAAAAASAFLVSRGFDQLISSQGSGGGERATGLSAVAVGLTLAGVAAAWLRVDEAVRSQRIGQSYVHRLRLRLWDHLYATPWSEVSRRRRSGVLLRFTGDLSSFQAWITHGMIGGGVAAVIAMGALAALGTLSLSLMLGVLAVMVVGTVASVSSGSKLRRVVRHARRARSRLIDDIEERVEALGSVQASGQGARERKRIVRGSKDMLRALVASARVAGGLRAIGDLGTILIVVIVLLLGTHEVAAGRAGAGAAVAALVVSRFLVGPLRRVARAHQHWQRSRVARQKFEEFLARPAPLRQRRRARLTDRGNGQIELRRVTIAGVLRRRTTSVISAGSRVALTGANGAGKSTLLRILAGLEVPSRGNVLIDGERAGNCQLESLSRTIGFVSSDQPLMRGTVRRNLLYRCPRAPLSEVDRVVALTCLDDLFPSLDARVARGGMNLSAGQRQRLLLARALVGNPRVLLLDEPEAHLDEAGLLVLRRIVDSLAGTVVWATHDPRNAAMSDTIWTLKDERLACVRSGRVTDGALVPIDFDSHRKKMREIS